MVSNLRIVEAIKKLKEYQEQLNQRYKELLKKQEQTDDLFTKNNKKLLEELNKEIDGVETSIEELEKKLNNKLNNIRLKHGKDGINGRDGINGKDGKDGKNGINGRDGIDGEDGLNGKDGKDGKDGVGILDIEINKKGELVITLTNKKIINAGRVRGLTGIGIAGSNGKDGVSVTNAEIRQGHLYITLSNGTEIDAGVVSGGGSGGDEVDPIFTTSPAYNITSQDITNWNNKSDFSGDYEDLDNKPLIPTKTSDLTNDSNFIDTSYHDNTKQDNIEDLVAIRTGANLGSTALQPNDNISELVNDAGYITSYTETDPVFTNSVASGITQNDITNWNNKSEFSGDYNDLTNKPTIPTVPTNVSAFTNDAGYLTQHQDISGKYDKTGGEITGNVKIDGTLTLDIEDEDYDSGITFTKTLDTNLGTVLTVTGYANANGSNTNYKPIIRNIGTPSQNYDVANKKYVDDNILRPDIYLCALKNDGTIDVYSSTLNYNTVKSELTNRTVDVYLDIIFGNTRFFAKANQDLNTNTGPILFFGNYFDASDNTQRLIMFALNNNNTLDVYHMFLETQNNKVSSVVSNSTSTLTYPNTKAVFDEFQRKPVVVWESNDPSQYLKAVQSNLSASPSWQLTNLDLTPFKRIKIYSCAGQKSGATASASTTPAIILEMSLDSRNTISAYGDNYVGSVMVQKPNDANRFATLTCAVSSDKTSFVVLRQSNLYGTAVTGNDDVNANVFMIEGYYD